MQIKRPALIPALAALTLCTTPALVAAQGCLGNASFITNHLQLNGDVIVNDDFEELGAAFVGGSGSFFGGLGVGSTTFDGGDANVALRVTAGSQTPISYGGKLQVCPLLRLRVGFPKQNYNGSGGEFSTQSYSIGVGVGGEMFRAARLAVVPSLQAGVQRDLLKLSGGIAPESIQDTYAYVGFALGLVANDALSLRPSVMLPADSRFDGPIFGVGLALNYGGRR